MVAPLDSKPAEWEPFHVDALIKGLEAELDIGGVGSVGQVHRRPKETLGELDAEPNWAWLYELLGEPASMVVDDIRISHTELRDGVSYHRFYAVLTAEYDPPLRYPMKCSSYDEMTEQAVERAWPEADWISSKPEYVQHSTTCSSLSVAVGIEVPFDERHLEWLEPDYDGEFELGLLATGLPPTKMNAIVTERADGAIGRTGITATATIGPATFDVSHVTETVVVDRVLVSKGDMVFGAAELSQSYDIANLNGLTVDSVDLEIS